jgi:hypothetical protein
MGIHRGDILFKTGRLNTHPVRSSKLMIKTNPKDNQTILWFTGIKPIEYQWEFNFEFDRCIPNS